MRHGEEVGDCPFCSLSPDRLAGETASFLVVRDAYPVSRGHTLVIPKRHCASLFELSEAEFADLQTALDSARRALVAEYGPDGFNVGINDGPVAGQTVMHLHVHLIPRYAGDSEDPRGGVRWVFPERARYWK